MDVIDLHCDLLGYLACNPDRTPLESAPRCSGPQLQEGKVKLQVLAIFSETNPLSLVFGLRQLEIFLSLPKQYPTYFSNETILPAFENASSFCIETEALQPIFHRLEHILEKISPLYISLTWNGENRFGGGCGSTVGLKEDGKELLTFLSGRGIAIDFSHTSDQLAYEILRYIDTRKLSLKVMASHSNFRAKKKEKRNLPDEIAKEIIQRQGLIGLTMYKKFLGNIENLYEQILYGLHLGGEKALSFGADFFCLEDFSNQLEKEKGPIGFFEEMPDASAYPLLLEKIQKNTGISTEQLKAIASENAKKFIISRNKTLSLIK